MKLYNKFENESLKFEHKLSCILILTLSSGGCFTGGTANNIWTQIRPDKTSGSGSEISDFV